MRNASSKRASRDEVMLNQIRDLKSDHPLWGYRNIWSYLRFRKGVVIGKNRVYRLMRKHGLLVAKNTRLKAKRGVLRPKPVAGKLNQYWGMDMTKIKFPSGWRYLHVVLDWYNKEILSAHLSITSTAKDWLDALDEAVNSRFPKGIAQQSNKPRLITDNGCQPMAEKFKKACDQLGIEQIFTSFNNPKGNADTERVIRTIKEGLVWPYDWVNPIKFEVKLKQWINQYNTDFPHMSLGWKTPAQFKQNTLLVAA